MLRQISSNTILGLAIILIALSTVALYTYLEERRRIKIFFGNRPQISLNRVYERYFRETSVSLKTFEETMCIIENIIGYKASILRPDDDLAILCPDLDLCQVIIRLGRELDLQIMESIRCPLDARVDSLVRFVQEARTIQEETATTNHA